MLLVVVSPAGEARQRLVLEAGDRQVWSRLVLRVVGTVPCVGVVVVEDARVGGLGTRPREHGAGGPVTGGTAA